MLNPHTFTINERLNSDFDNEMNNVDNIPDPAYEKIPDAPLPQLQIDGNAEPNQTTPETPTTLEAIQAKTPSIFHDSGFGDCEQSICESGGGGDQTATSAEITADDRVQLRDEIEQQTEVADETSEQMVNDLTIKRADKMSELKDMTERVSFWLLINWIQIYIVM